MVGKSPLVGLLPSLGWMSVPLVMPSPQAMPGQPKGAALRHHGSVLGPDGAGMTHHDAHSLALGSTISFSRFFSTKCPFPFPPWTPKVLLFQASLLTTCYFNGEQMMHKDTSRFTELVGDHRAGIQKSSFSAFFFYQPPPQKKGTVKIQTVF